MSPESFSAAWLALREGVDHRSRASELLDPLRAWWADRSDGTILDLGAGSGSNVRYLAPKLPRVQQWTCVDHDETLLARIEPKIGNARIRTSCVDLAAGTGSSDGPGALVDGHDLVTASALLDLVSEAWLEHLVDACARVGAAALFALSYDGEVAWSGGGLPMDARVLDAVNRHQLTDKGFGAALGPEASVRAEAAFRARGYRTWSVPSPWVLTGADVALAQPLIEGWASAAVEVLPQEDVALRAWAERRVEDVRSGRSPVRVGHKDLLALPPESGTP